MNLLGRYLAREIYASVLLVFASLLMLFSFLDFIHELSVMGYGKYSLGYVLAFVALTVPGHIYELFPVAVLVGTILALVLYMIYSNMISVTNAWVGQGKMSPGVGLWGIHAVMLMITALLFYKRVTLFSWRKVLDR